MHTNILAKLLEDMGIVYDDLSGLPDEEAEEVLGQRLIEVMGRCYPVVISR